MKSEKGTPHVSVLVANFNGAGVVERCLESVFAQHVDFEFEVLVHDDASTDESVSRIEAHFPHAVILESRTNVGFCRANNRMAEMARGQYLLLLNNDAWLAPNSLATLASAAEREGNPVLLSLPQTDAASGDILDHGCALDPFFNPVPLAKASKNPVAYAMGALLWIPASVWSEVKGFPAWLESIGEDLYFCQAARQLGIATKVLDSPAYFHEVGHSFGGGKITAAGLSTTRRRRYLSERNKMTCLAIFAPAPYLAAFLPLHLLLLVLEGIVIAVARLDAGTFFNVYIRAFGAFVRRLPLALAERDRLRRLRVRHAAAVALPFLTQLVWVPHKLFLLLKHGIPRIRK